MNDVQFARPHPQAGGNLGTQYALDASHISAAGGGGLRSQTTD